MCGGFTLARTWSAAEKWQKRLERKARKAGPDLTKMLVLCLPKQLC